MLAKGLAALAGLLLAGIAQFIAYLMIGGGEGWGTPFLFSPLLLIANPVVFARAVGRDSSATWVDFLLLAIGLLADVLVAVQTYVWEARYFHTVLTNFAWLVILWILLWTAWQVLILQRILRWRLNEL